MSRYHLKREDRRIKSIDQIKNILKNAKYITISMCRNNEPYIVTMNYGYDSLENSLYFHCAKEGLKLEFLKDNKNVCATIIDDHGYQQGKCDHAYESIVIWGKMLIIKKLSEKQKAIKVLINHLETNPEEVIKRILNKSDVLEKFLILKLEINHIIGKSSFQVSEV